MPESAQPWTVLRLINWTRDYFDKLCIEDARLAAEMLLAHVLGCRRIELYTRFDHQPSPQQLEAFRELVKRAGAFEPVAYLVGQKEFYSLRFKVTSDVLIPRSESEILVTEALAHLRALGRECFAWDVGTGSGCVGVALASQLQQARVLATDISPAAIEVARENAAANGVDQRVTLAVADMLTLPPQWNGPALFDAIVSNPPYIAQNQAVADTVRHEPAVALYGGKAGLDLLQKLIAAAPAFLSPGGVLAIEFGYAMEDTVRDLIVATGEFDEPRILADHQGIDRSAVAKRK
jgi:release factor glutamine methyltransferase